MKVMSKVFKAGICVSYLVAVARQGEQLGEIVVPRGMIGFATVCSIVVNGALLRAGVPMDSRFGGILDIRDRKTMRFVELIHYAGSSLDPSGVFIRGKMTTVSQAAGKGRGKVLANFKLGSAMLCAGRTEVAEGHLQIALDLSREMGLAIQEMQSLAALSRVKLLSGDAAMALEFSSKVIEKLGDDMPPDANELHFTHAKVLKANGRGDESLPHLERARLSVLERAETIQDDTLRGGFLDACREILTAWEAEASTSPE